MEQKRGAENTCTPRKNDVAVTGASLIAFTTRTAVAIVGRAKAIACRVRSLDSSARRSSYRDMTRYCVGISIHDNLKSFRRQRQSFDGPCEVSSEGILHHIRRLCAGCTTHWH